MKRATLETTQTPCEAMIRPRKAPPRDAATLARQQAGWFAARDDVGGLNANEIFLVRFDSAYQFVGSEEYQSRVGDLRTAAGLAGLEFDQHGWKLPGEPTPYESRSYYHTMTDEPHRLATIYGQAWAYDILCRNTFRVQTMNPYEVISRLIWNRLSAFSWAWWCCRLEDNDSRLSITERGLKTWIEDAEPDLRRVWTPEEVGERQGVWAWRNRHLRLDMRHLAEAARDTPLKIAR